MKRAAVVGRMMADADLAWFRTGLRSLDSRRPVAPGNWGSKPAGALSSSFPDDRFRRR